RYEPQTLSTLDARVEVVAGGSVVAIRKLKQLVIEPTGHLFTLTDTVIAALIGDSDVTLEVLHAFKPYIFDTTRVDYPEIPPAFLAALVYAEANRVGPKKRTADLEAAAEAFNASTSTALSNLAICPLGVCQILQERLAMVAPRATSTNDSRPTYTEWQELSAAERDRPAQVKAIRAAYLNLAPSEKIELYNLLRFPKSSVRMCA